MYFFFKVSIILFILFSCSVFSQRKPNEVKSPNSAQESIKDYFGGGESSILEIMMEANPDVDEIHLYSFNTNIGDSIVQYFQFLEQISTKYNVKINITCPVCYLLQESEKVKPIKLVEQFPEIDETVKKMTSLFKEFENDTLTGEKLIQKYEEVIYNIIYDYHQQ